jgi:hypothetical protein
MRHAWQTAATLSVRAPGDGGACNAARAPAAMAIHAATGRLAWQTVATTAVRVQTDGKVQTVCKAQAVSRSRASMGGHAWQTVASTSVRAGTDGQATVAQRHRRPLPHGPTKHDPSTCKISANGTFLTQRACNTYIFKVHP